MFGKKNKYKEGYIENKEDSIQRSEELYTAIKMNMLADSTEIASCGIEIGPCIFIYENIINNSEELIQLAHSQNDFKKEMAGLDSNGKQYNDTSIRKTIKIDIDPIYKNDIRWFIVAKTLWKYGDIYAKQQNISFSFMEFPQFLHYETGAGFYKPHSDAGPGIERIFSAVLYLNDVESGGETYFNNFDISVKPKSGRLVLFPANYVYVHEARIPISNEKNAIVTWFRQ